MLTVIDESKRFTSPAEYWGGRVKAAQGDLDRTLRTLGVCLEELEEHKKIASLAYLKLVGAGVSERDARRAMENDLDEKEAPCKALAYVARQKNADLNYVKGKLTDH